MAMVFDTLLSEYTLVLDELVVALTSEVIGDDRLGSVLEVHHLPG